jgi:hypothetical protein
VKIGESSQMDIGFVPTLMGWKKVQTAQGEFTLLVVSTPVGSWGFLMPRQMVLDLERGMHEMASTVHVARTVPPASGLDGEGGRTQ